MNAKAILKPTLRLFLIATITTILLVLTNNQTEEAIAEQKEQSDIASRQEVLPEADGFDEETVTVDGTEYTYYKATNDAGYVFSASNKGYGGQVVCMVGINSDGEITGVKLTEQSETAGLGAKWAGTDDYGVSQRAQFNGAIIDGDTYSVTKDGGTIEAVSGATITSRAVCADVTDCVAQYRAVTE